MEQNNENLDICSSCQGKCCKIAGCAYFVTDFPNLTRESVMEILAEGRTSIAVENLMTFKEDGTHEWHPVLLLRARNQNKGEIDLISMPSRCASLESNGCFYDYAKRPGFGRGLTPHLDGNCEPNFNVVKEIEAWLPYQDILKEVAEKKSGRPFLEVLNTDIENFLKAYYTHDYPHELEIIKEEAEDLAIVCPDIAAKVLKDITNNSLNSKIMIPNVQSSTLENPTKYTNEALCKACGGRCCQISGCNYLTTDIKEFTKESILAMLDSGYVSIAADINVNQKGSKIITFLLKARGKERGEIDLLSIDTPCSLLGSEGCLLPFASRPGEGRHLTPKRQAACTSDLDIDEEINKWQPYQKIFQEIIELKTGQNWEKVFKEDIKNYFINVLTDNYGSSVEEAIIRANNYANYLFTLYPNEALKAIEEIKKNSIKRMRKKK